MWENHLEKREWLWMESLSEKGKRDSYQIRYLYKCYLLWKCVTTQANLNNKNTTATQPIGFFLLSRQIVWLIIYFIPLNASIKLIHFLFIKCLYLLIFTQLYYLYREKYCYLQQQNSLFFLFLFFFNFVAPLLVIFTSAISSW